MPGATTTFCDRHALARRLSCRRRVCSGATLLIGRYNDTGIANIGPRRSMTAMQRAKEADVRRVCFQPRARPNPTMQHATGRWAMRLKIDDESVVRLVTISTYNHYYSSTR